MLTDSGCFTESTRAHMRYLASFPTELDYCQNSRKSPVIFDLEEKNLSACRKLSNAQARTNYTESPCATAVSATGVQNFRKLVFYEEGFVSEEAAFT